MDSILFITISTLTLAGHSLAASHLFRANKLINPTTLLLISIIPAFVAAVIYLPFIGGYGSISAVGLMILKQILYVFVFFIRLQSFRDLGAYAGGTLLIAQPIMVAMFSWLLLGESLSLSEMGLAALTLCGIWVVSASSQEKIYSSRKLTVYMALPAILMAVIAVVERYILLTHMSGVEFFVVDKLVMLPTFLLIYLVLMRFIADEFRIQLRAVSGSRLFVIVLVLGFLWGASSLFYGLALELQKTLWVTMIRSLAFTLVALLGSFLDQKPLSAMSILGLGMASIGGALFAFH